MRSILVASTWVVLRHGAWNLLAGSLLAIAVPALVITALRREGGFDPADPSIVLISLLFAQIGVLTVGLGCASKQEPAQRLAVLPVPTAMLAACQMLPVMALVFVHSLTSIWVLNAMFALDWPLWGPALTMMVMSAAMQAMSWLLGNSAWFPVGIAVVVAPIGIWFKSRYGASLRFPEHYWRTVQPAEIVTLLAAGLTAYGVGLLGLARRRRGEPPGSLGILAWLDQVLPPYPYNGPGFASAAQAQAWNEWRVRGNFMPMACGFLLSMYVIGWTAFSRDPQTLFDCLVGSGFALSMLALIGGFVLGQRGNNFRPEMGSFLATRPLSTVDMNRIVLKVAAQSVALSWCIWAVTLAVASAGIRLATGRFDVLGGYQAFQWWWFLEASLLGPWIAMSVALAMGLTGRDKLTVAIIGIGLVIWLTGQILASWFLSPSSQVWLLRALIAALGLGLGAATIWLYWRAWSQSLISSLLVAAAGVALPVLVGVPALSHIGPSTEPWLAGVLIVSAACLAVAPLAAAPLALQWNRHR